VELSFRNLGVEIEWKGEGEKETGTVKDFHKELISDDLNDIRDIYSDLILKFLKKGNVVVKIDKNYYRPTEVDLLIGDATKAKEKLNWSPKVTFGELVRLMIKADFEKVLKRGF